MLQIALYDQKFYFCSFTVFRCFRKYYALARSTNPLEKCTSAKLKSGAKSESARLQKSFGGKQARIHEVSLLGSMYWLNIFSLAKKSIKAVTGSGGHHDSITKKYKKCKKQ